MASNSHQDKAISSKQPGTQFSQVCLEQLRQQVHAFAVERDWEQYHTPRNLLLALTGEVWQPLQRVTVF